MFRKCKGLPHQISPRKLSLKVRGLVITLIALSIVPIVQSCSESAEGLYSTTVPTGGGEGKDGYPVISLKEDYTVEWVVRYRGDYTVGRWSEEDGGIRISGMVHHDIDGLYKWNEHPHGEGIENPGMVLSEKSSYPMGKVLFPVDGVQNP